MPCQYSCSTSALATEVIKPKGAETELNFAASPRSACHSFRGQDPSGKAKILLGLVIKEFGLCAEGTEGKEKKDGFLYSIEKE